MNNKTLFAIILMLCGSSIGAEMPDMKDFPGGLVVHIGCGDGKRTVGLHANDRCIIHGLDADPDNVEKARKAVLEAGLYGKVTIDHLPGDKLPYIDNLANMIVADDAGKITTEEIMRVLAPYGTAIVKGKKTVKPWPAEMAEWNHWLCGPDNNAVSNDKKVGISRRMQWTMPPRWGRHHNLLPSLCTMVSAKGRIYCIIDEAPIAVKGKTDKWALICRDGFNGLLLWRKPIVNWGWQKWSAIQVGGTMRFKGPDQLFRRVVAVGDRVYFTPGFNEPVIACDGATGKTILEYKGTENAAEILVSGKVTFLARNAADKPGKDILAVDTASGKILWEKTGFVGITSRGDELKKFTDAYLTVGKDKVFFLNEDDVVALDARTGAEAWKSPRPVMQKGVLGHYSFEFKNFCSLVYHDGIVYLGQIHPGKDNLNKWQTKNMELWAFDAATGEKLWQHTGMTLSHFTPPDLFVNNGMVWTMKQKTISLLGLDAKTGEVKKEYPAKGMLVGHHHRCYRNKATANFYLAGEEGIEYIDFNTGKLDVHHWLRGACAYGLMPANGLIYLPTHACGCHTNTKLNGFFAIASGKVDLSNKPQERLEKGPAFGMKPGDSPAPTDWPEFKHDSTRSNHVDAEIPSSLSVKWTKKLGRGLTAPIAVEGCVYLTSRDECTLFCLDSSSGEIKWRVVTDGPVNTPPTYDRGRLFFGTAAGTVCSLSANDGKLIWRFTAAPANLRMMSFDRLESPWPVDGSVLVIGDKVCFVAGRSMNLDSGMYMYILDSTNGKILQENHMQADTESKGELKATLPGLLVSDGETILMRNLQFSVNDIKKQTTAKSGSLLTPNDGGLLDDSWLNNAFWKYGSAQGQMLVFDDSTAFGIKAFSKLVSKSYGQDVFTPGKGEYTLFAVDLKGSKQAPADNAGKTRKGKKKKGKAGSAKSMWQIKLPVRAHAMVLSRKHLVVAGAPDIVDSKDPWAAFEDRKGGVLQVHAKADGKKAGELKLESTPVYDGMAAAGGTVFISLKNGSVVCLK